MVKQGTLLSELRSIVGKKHAHEPKDEHDCTVDGMSPKAVAEAGAYEEVAEILRFANTERLAVIPRGGGMQAELGNIPSRYDIALDLRRLDKVIEHEPADLTVTCQAGISVGKLDAHLSQSGQMVPLMPDPNPAVTVGGLVALNMSYMRVTYGSPRDFTIGLSVITADGRISKAGGKVVKNVAGYDLCKLYIGSRGTLAVIVEATFKAYPRPEIHQTASFEFTDCVDACRVAMDMRAQGLNPVDAHVLRPTVAAGSSDNGLAGYVLELAFAGGKAAVQNSQAEARNLAAGANASEFDWGRQRSGSAPVGLSPTGRPLSVRAHLLPSRVPAFIRAVEGDGPAMWDAAPLLGEVTSVWPGEGDHQQWIERTLAATAQLGGTLQVQFCPPELKRRIDVFGPPPPSFPLMRAIKQQFDPNNVLSPGRFVGRL